MFSTTSTPSPISIHLSSLQRHVQRGSDGKEERFSFNRNRTRSVLLLNPSLIVRPRSGKSRGTIKPISSFWKDSPFRKVEYNQLKEQRDDDDNDEDEEESIKFDGDNNKIWNGTFKDIFPDKSLQFSSSPAQYNLSTAIQIVKHHSRESLGTVSTDSSESREVDNVVDYDERIFGLADAPAIKPDETRVAIEVQDNQESTAFADFEKAPNVAIIPVLSPDDDGAALCAAAKQAVYKKNMEAVSESTSACKRVESSATAAMSATKEPSPAELSNNDTPTMEETSTALVHRMPRTFLCSDIELDWIMPIQAEGDNNDWGHYPETLAVEDASASDKDDDNKSLMEAMEEAADDVMFEDFVTSQQQKTHRNEPWHELLDGLDDDDHDDDDDTTKEESMLEDDDEDDDSEDVTVDSQPSFPSAANEFTIVKASTATAATVSTNTTLFSSLEVFPGEDGFEILLQEKESFEVTNLQHVAYFLKAKKALTLENSHDAAVANEQYLLNTSWLNSMFALDNNKDNNLDDIDQSINELGGKRHGHHYLLVLDGHDTSMTLANDEDGSNKDPVLDVFCIDDGDGNQQHVIFSGVEVVGVAIQANGAVEI